MLPVAGVFEGVPVVVPLLLLLGIAILAGFAGALLGLGGGLILVPALYLVFGLDIHLAVAASLISVIATSLASGAGYVESGLANLRLGMFLETATAVGGLVGAVISVSVLAEHGDVIVALFVPAVLAAAYLMLRHRGEDSTSRVSEPTAEKFGLGGRYYDVPAQRWIEYRVVGTRRGLALSSLAGISSGLLGIGGGTFKVPAMTSLMNVPMRVAGATSNFMIGVTATSGAIVYLLAGDVGLLIAAPVILGVFVGSLAGARAATTAPTRGLKTIFAALLIATALWMAIRAFGVVH